MYWGEEGQCWYRLDQHKVEEDQEPWEESVESGLQQARWKSHRDRMILEICWEEAPQLPGPPMPTQFPSRTGAGFGCTQIKSLIWVQ